MKRNKSYSVLAAAIVLFAVCVMTACMTPKRAVKQLAVIELKQPQVLHDYLLKHSITDSFMLYDTIYNEGEVVYDTLTIDCDSVVYKTVLKTKVVKVPYPKLVTDTLIITKTKTINNKLQGDLIKERLDKTTYARDIWKWIAISLMGYTVLRWLIKGWFKITLP